MFYGMLALFVALIALSDQITKAMTMASIAPGAQVPVIDGLFHLTHVHNTGAAFSSLEGMRWLFVVIFLVLTVAIGYELVKKTMPFSRLEWVCIAAIYGGGLGNLIDRLRLGYVVDMIEVEFIRFPVFNVADCFITCGCIAMLISLVFVNREFWKDGKK